MEYDEIMTTDQTNLVLEHLRHIRDQVDDIESLKNRIWALETDLSLVNQRLDRIDKRIEEVECRQSDAMLEYRNANWEKLCAMSPEELDRDISSITQEQWDSLK